MHQNSVFQLYFLWRNNDKTGALSIQTKALGRWLYVLALVKMLIDK